MAEVAELQDRDAGAGGRGEESLEESSNDALAQIPNLPLDEVPDGKDEHDNVEHHHFGAKRNYAFTPKQHFELGEALGLHGFRERRRNSPARASWC